MSIKNEYAIELAIKKAAENKRRQEFTMQMCVDAAVIAANKTFNRKGEKVVEFAEEMIDIFYDIAELTVEDAKGDESLEYTKAKVDERLHYILGDKFQDWDTRYNAIMNQQ